MSKKAEVLAEKLMKLDRKSLDIMAVVLEIDAMDLNEAIEDLYAALEDAQARIDAQSDALDELAKRLLVASSKEDPVDVFCKFWQEWGGFTLSDEKKDSTRQV